MCPHAYMGAFLYGITFALYFLNGILSVREPCLMEMNIIISPEVGGEMDKRFILFEDVQKVVEHSLRTGQRFFNPGDSSFLARLRIENVTYWVRYREKEDGIHILTAYSHRMEIVEEKI